MGDFTGFSFNGYHSDDLGIIRVSDGDRYDENILPEFEDKVVDIPGGDGSYYYGSYFQPKEFSIKIAFDHLTEKQYRDLRRVFSTRLPKPLFFDEAPYKVYYAKLSSPIELNTVCFYERKVEYVPHGENDGYIPGSIDHLEEVVDTKVRIYKGEGTIDLIAYKPFGYIRFKDLDSYKEGMVYNVQPEDDPSELNLYELQVEEIIFKSNFTPLVGYEGWAEFSFSDLNGIEYDGISYDHVSLTYGSPPNDIKVYQIPSWRDNNYRRITVLDGWDSLSAETKELLRSYSQSIKTKYVLTEDTEPQEGKIYYYDVSNVDEWEEASGLKTAAELEDYDTYDNGTITLYNPGDISAPFKLYVPFSGNTINALTISLVDVDGAQLEINSITKKDNDTANGIFINTNNCLIEGVVYDPVEETYTTTGYIYNDYIDEGNFFKIPASSSLDEYEDIEMHITGGSDGIKIVYDYLYF